ncbi:hypothetical protein BJD55_gp135 [Gordonia phage Yvonnetastic]|uniref:Uncharacterized protein n=1 Tax=Gordonia phage Yvonnetastic TaxID=1821566 RepID=A0A142K948_9CAUD|nr:hypothetical protein BJD55_gp135 [Gordonia phage Yvonnetastic]AMS02631.1 hypothetical protein SEA_YVONNETASTIC_87 [Gordonia phage Yvonnetastic]WKW86063.1 hypothetical protein SEA_JONJAMES_89 [Gordonia Phage JonJames]
MNGLEFIATITGLCLAAITIQAGLYYHHVRKENAAQRESLGKCDHALTSKWEDVGRVNYYKSTSPSPLEIPYKTTRKQRRECGQCGLVEYHEAVESEARS